MKVNVDPETGAESEDRSAIGEPDITEVLDLDDEDAETGLPYGRERPN